MVNPAPSARFTMLVSARYAKLIKHLLKKFKVDNPMVRYDVLARLAACSLCFVVCCIVGCGDGASVKVYPASGTVNYKGKAVDDAVVTFSISGKEGQPSTIIGTGTTDKQGRFKILTTIEGNKTLEGAVEGSHQVLVAKYVLPKGWTEERYAEAQALETKIMQEQGIVPPDKQAPLRVSMFSPKQLSANVEPGGKNDFTFELD